MIRIYELECEGLCLYVGKTKGPLNIRANQHRCKKYKSHSRYIPADCEWTIKLLEECPDEIGTAREQYWYDLKKPLYNHNRPGQTQKESECIYREKEKNKEARKEYLHTYREKNKEARNEYQRARRARKKAQSDA